MSLITKLAAALGKNALLLLLLSSAIFGQSLSLNLPSGSGVVGSTVSLAVGLSGTATAGQPASLQFNLAFSANDFSSITVTAGSVAAAAGKSVSCNASTGQLMCMIWGLNTTSMTDGQIAVVSATLSSNSTSSIRAISITQP